MEAWLVPQTRTIEANENQPLELTQSTLFGKHFDHLVGNKFFTEQQIIDLGKETQSEVGLPFPLAIQEAVGHLYKAWHTG